MKQKITLIFYLACAASFFYHASSCMAQAPSVKKWDHSFGSTSNDQLACFAHCSDGGFLLCGRSNSAAGGDKSLPAYGLYDFWLVRTDASGNFVWEKTFGGDATDYPYGVKQTRDGGFIAIGHSNSNATGTKTQPKLGGYDYYVIKVDASGNLQWDRVYGTDQNDYGKDVIQTSDGGYLLVGYSYGDSIDNKTQHTFGGFDGWVVKIDSLGSYQWDKSYGGSGGEALFDIIPASDGGYILGGETNSLASGNKSSSLYGIVDYWLVKIDSLGALQWDSVYGGTTTDELFAMCNAPDGGYVLAGYSDSPADGDKTDSSKGGNDYWVVKVNAKGAMQWNKDFGATGVDHGVGSVNRTMDGGYLVTGTSYSPADGDKTENNLGQEQTWVVKMDSLGKKVWDKTVFTAGHDEGAWGLETSDGCIVVMNYSNSDSGGYKSTASKGVYDYWIVKLCDTVQCVKPKADFSPSSQSFCGDRCIDFINASSGAVSYKWQLSGATIDTSSDKDLSQVCYSTPGLFPVTLIASNGACSDSITKYIDYYIFVPPVIVQRNDTIWVPSGYISYQWFLNGVTIGGATDSFYVVKSAGNYSVQVNDSNNCQGFSNPLTTGIDELHHPGFNLSPNPVTGGMLMLSALPFKETTVKIFNALGAEIYSATIAARQLQIDVSLLPAGLYVTRLSGSSADLYTKFVKQ